MDWEEFLRQHGLPPGWNNSGPYLNAQGGPVTAAGASPVSPVAPFPVLPANMVPMQGGAAPNPYGVQAPDTSGQFKQLSDLLNPLQAELHQIPSVPITMPNPSAPAPLPPSDSPLGRLRSDMIASASGPTEAQLQATQSGASGASANAILNAFKNSGYGTPNAQDYLWKNIAQSPYPTENLPDVPGRVAPKFDPLSRAIGAIAGMFVPRAAGELNAAPIDAALNVAQVQTGDKQKAYEQTMQQAAIQQANAVASRQDAFRNAVMQQEETLKGNENLTAAQRTAGATLAPSEGTAAASQFLTNALTGTPATQTDGSFFTNSATPAESPGTQGLSGQELAANQAKAAVGADTSAVQALRQQFEDKMSVEGMRLKYGDQIAGIVEKGLMGQLSISQKLYYDQLRAQMANQRNDIYGRNVDNMNTFHQGELSNQTGRNSIMGQHYSDERAYQFGMLKVDQEKADVASSDSKINNDPAFKMLMSGYESALKAHNELLQQHNSILGKPNSNPYQLQQVDSMLQSNEKDLININNQMQGFKAARAHPAPDSASHVPAGTPGGSKYMPATPPVGKPIPGAPPGGYQLPGQ